MMHKIKNIIQASIGPVWGPRLVFFVSLVVYIRTMAPTIGSIDSGELSMVCQTLGIAHPTGYPLYTLIGRLWVSIIPFGELAWKLNLLSALFMALSAGWLCRIIMDLEVRKEIAFSSSLIYAFSPVIWHQAVFLEVYALTVLLAMMLLWLAVRYHKIHDQKYVMLGAFAAGLGLGNHLSLLWLFPGLLLLVFSKFLRTNPRIIILGALFFVFGLSIYLFLPVRSNLAPLFNWGNPDNWERFFWHISGRQYRVWMFNQSVGELSANLVNFAKLWLGNPQIYLWWPIIPGAWVLFRKDKKLFWSLLIIFVLTVFYGINYSIPDIEAYFIPAFICSFIFMALGLAWILELIKAKIKHRATVLAFQGIFLVLFILPLAVNFGSNDNRRNQLVYAVAGSALESADPNAVILIDNRDIYAPGLYLMHHENIRTDIVMIDQELLRRDWYYNYLEKCYPEYYGSCREQIEAFRKQLYFFEHGSACDSHAIQREYAGLLNALLLNNYYDNPPYLVRNKLPEDHARLAPQYKLVPEGLLFRLTMSDAVEAADDEFMFDGRLLDYDTLKMSGRERALYRLFPARLYQRGLYLAQNFLLEEALTCFLQALKYERNRAALYVALGGAYMGLNRAGEARDSFLRALALEPDNQLVRENLKRISPFLPGGPKAISTEIN